MYILIHKSTLFKLKAYQSVAYQSVLPYTNKVKSIFWFKTLLIFLKTGKSCKAAFLFNIYYATDNG